MLLDAADLITFGMVGVWTGFALGAILGWTLAPQLGFADRRWLPMLLAGAYCTLPGTALMPLATLLTGVRAWAGEGEAGPQQVEPRPEPGDERVIEAEYRSRWDEGERGPRD